MVHTQLSSTNHNQSLAVGTFVAAGIKRNAIGSKIVKPTNPPVSWYRVICSGSYSSIIFLLSTDTSTVNKAASSPIKMPVENCRCVLKMMVMPATAKRPSTISIVSNGFFKTSGSKMAESKAVVERHVSAM